MKYLFITSGVNLGSHCLTSSSCKTSCALNGTSCILRICTTALEKPQRGCSGTPFMKTTTSFAFTSEARRFWRSLLLLLPSEEKRRKAETMEGLMPFLRRGMVGRQMKGSILRKYERRFWEHLWHSQLGQPFHHFFFGHITKLHFSS